MTKTYYYFFLILLHLGPVTSSGKNSWNDSISMHRAFLTVVGGSCCIYRQCSDQELEAHHALKMIAVIINNSLSGDFEFFLYFCSQSQIGACVVCMCGVVPVNVCHLWPMEQLPSNQYSKKQLPLLWANTPPLHKMKRATNER